MDADVIKTYVELGMGVGLVAGIAFESERDSRLRAVDAGHLFGINTTKLAVRRGAYLRAYVYEFIESFSPMLTRATVEAALGEVTDLQDRPAAAVTQAEKHAQQALARLAEAQLSAG